MIHSSGDRFGQNGRSLPTLEHVPPRWILALAAATLTLTTAAGCEVPQDSGGPSGSSSDSAKAVDLLETLAVAKAGTMARYSREKFPHWRSTGENCDVRDSVLKRDGTKVKYSGCNVVAGTWTSLYDGKVLNSPTKVDIDHVVPLANAWRSGAAAWTTEKRSDFANDLDRPCLLYTSPSPRDQRGSRMPSSA